ncbi:MAG: hypothetical protein D6729_15040, partial [Deltaproteobacteria bacterium]
MLAAMEGGAARARGDSLAELEAVAEIGKILTSTLDLRDVLGRIVDKIGALLQPYQWSLLLVDEDTGGLRFEIAVGAGAEE